MSNLGLFAIILISVFSQTGFSIGALVFIFAICYPVLIITNDLLLYTLILVFIFFLTGLNIGAFALIFVLGYPAFIFTKRIKGQNKMVDIANAVISLTYIVVFSSFEVKLMLEAETINISDISAIFIITMYVVGLPAIYLYRLYKYHIPKQVDDLENELKNLPLPA